MPTVLSNLIFFKAVWALSLYGVVIEIAWLGFVGLLLFMAWHVWRAESAGADFIVIVCAVCIGTALDTLYLRSDLISYNGELLWTTWAPLWIIALWANLALTLNGCLRWLQDRLWLAAALGFVFGPIGYVGGIALGTATVTGNPWILFTVIGIAWAVTLPLLLALAGRLLSKTAHKTTPEPGPRTAPTAATT